MVLSPSSLHPLLCPPAVAVSAETEKIFLESRLYSRPSENIPTSFPPKDALCRPPPPASLGRLGEAAGLAPKIPPVPGVTPRKVAKSCSALCALPFEHSHSAHLLPTAIISHDVGVKRRGVGYIRQLFTGQRHTPEIGGRKKSG